MQASTGGRVMEPGSDFQVEKGFALYCSWIHLRYAISSLAYESYSAQSTNAVQAPSFAGIEGSYSAGTWNNTYYLNF